jgi:four helix bundle protein
MSSDDLKERTKRFALQIMRLTSSLPKTREADGIARQLIRSGTSVGANYRAACRAGSKADFISKIAIVEEEADESAYWLELLAEAGIVPKGTLENFLAEASELIAIFTATGRTARERNSRSVIHSPKFGGNSEFRNPKSALQNPRSEIRDPR